MLKNKTLSFLTALGLGFLTCMVFLCFSAEREARAVSDNVLRFHIVANSDAKEDQALKLKVRDGIAFLTDRLFADAPDKESAVAIAKENTDLIAYEAQRILRAEGCDDAVKVEIRKMYFPTKSYENVSFPAGKYDAIHITLGEGKGENFWCVMFPALCVGSVSESNEELLSGVLEEGEMDLVTRPYTLKFKLAEWLGNLRGIFS